MAEYRVIKTLGDFSKLKKPWNELLKGLPTEQVFMRHEWFDTWLQSRSDALRLQVVTGWRDGQLVSAAPLQLTDRKVRFLPYKALMFLQSTLSPRCHFLGAEEDDLVGLWRHLQNVPGWDLLEANNLELAQPATKLYQQFVADEGPTHHTTDGFQAPVLDIDGTWDEYLKAMNSKRRRYVRKECLARLEEKTDQHKIELITSPDDFERAWDIMVDVSNRSWKAEQGTALAQIDAAVNFYRGFTPIGLQNGWVHIWLLQLNNTYVAFDYYLTWNNRSTGVRSDYDGEFSWFHPGENLKIAILRHHFEHMSPGHFDFGGVAAGYKQRWANRTNKHINIMTPRQGLKSNAIVLLKNLKSRVADDETEN